jgi:CHAD domain-containing protein
MRAAFEIFGTAFKPKVLRKHLRGLRYTGRTLGAARDMDVILEKAEIYRQGLPEGNRPGLEPLLQFWEAEQAAARARLEIYLDSPDYADFKQKFYRFVTTPGAGESSASPEAGVPVLVCEQAPVLIYSRLAAVRSYEPFLPSASLEQLHALRIEFKKLRYTVEFFREVLGEEVKAVINDLKGVQDHLGDLNDASVVTGILSAFLASWDERQAGQPIGQRQNPEATIAYLANRHAERHHLMTTFAETWACFVRPEFRRNLALAVSAL